MSRAPLSLAAVAVLDALVERHLLLFPMLLLPCDALVGGALVAIHAIVHVGALAVVDRNAGSGSFPTRSSATSCPDDEGVPHIPMPQQDSDRSWTEDAVQVPPVPGEILVEPATGQPLRLRLRLAGRPQAGA